MPFPFIHSVRLEPVSWPLRSVFVTARGRKTHTDNLTVIVRLADGTLGKSEASSSIALASESQKNMQDILQTVIPEVRGRSIDDLPSLVPLIWSVSRFHPTAAAALESALWDAWARAQGKPLFRLLGDKQATLETDLTLSVDEPNAMAQRAKLAARRGFRRFKVKLAGKPDLDFARVAAVHGAVPKAQLVADGNQGFHWLGALSFVQKVKRAGLPIVFFEQPFPRLDLKNMRLLRQRTGIPVFADEAVLGVADATKVFAADAADGVNVKLAKCGLTGALEIIRLTRHMKKRLAIGCMEESKLGLAASVHLACATGAFEWVDLDSFFLLDVRPPRGGFEAKGAKLSVRASIKGIGL